MNITREQGQQMVVDAFARYGHLLVLYATGFGKAKAAIDAVKPFCTERSRGMIICHSEIARDDTWPSQLMQWGKDLKGKIILECYPSLAGYENETFDWVIADEAHYLTVANSEFFTRNHIRKVLLTTAMLPSDQDKVLILNRLSHGHKLEIKLDAAVQSGILNDYIIRVWKVKISPLEKERYIALCRHVESAVDSGNRMRINLAAGERARFIYNLETKYKAAVYLRDKIRATGKRMVIFTGSIDMANKLSPHRYHSETTSVDYKRFLNMEINEIASIKQIQEGANIPRLESSLIVQLNSKALNLVQKLGRQMRLEPGEIAKMHILVAEDTQDWTWCQRALMPLDKSKIYYHQLERNVYDT